MKDRSDRLIVPASVFAAFFAIPIAIWLESIDKFSINDLHDVSKYSIIFGFPGYLMHWLATTFVLSFDWFRLVDPKKLMNSFGINNENVCSEELRTSLLAEFHLRFHSHAPQSLIDHGTRRNTAMYISLSSAFAAVTGAVAAIIVIVTVFKDAPILLFERMCYYYLFVVVFAAISMWLSWKWNREYWEVCWIWIGWDIVTRPPPSDWQDEIRKKYITENMPRRCLIIGVIMLVLTNLARQR